MYTPKKLKIDDGVGLNIPKRNVADDIQETEIDRKDRIVTLSFIMLSIILPNQTKTFGAEKSMFGDKHFKKAIDRWTEEIGNLVKIAEVFSHSCRKSQKLYSNIKMPVLIKYLTSCREILQSVFGGQ